MATCGSSIRVKTSRGNPLQNRNIRALGRQACAGLGMEQLGQQLNALDNAWARPVEIGVAVNNIHPTGLHGGQPLPVGMSGQGRQLGL